MKLRNRDDNVAEKEELHNGEDDDVLMAAIESLPEEAQVQLLGAFMKFLPVGVSLLSNLLHKG